MSKYNIEKAFKVALAMREMEQKELAVKLKVTKQYLNAVVKGRCIATKPQMLRIVSELGFSLNEFKGLGR